ncbi:MAG: hypothetical protein AB2A00_28825, partial [Myxococcota bacterium]
AAAKPAPTAKAAAPAKAVVKPAPAPKPVPLKDLDKAAIERAAKAILKALRPLTADDDEGDREAQRNRLSLMAAHPRRRPDGEYEVFLRYNSGPGLADPEADAERQARDFFSSTEFANVPVAVDVMVLEERES